MTDTDKLSKADVAAELTNLSNWQISDSEQLEKEFTFENFHAAIRFINEIAKIAERENHHPDFFLHDWNKVRVSLSDHSTGGLTKRDFYIASQLDSYEI